MIFGNMAFWWREKHLFPSAFARALAFLERPDVATLAEGTYPIEGEDIYVMVQEPKTEPAHLRKFELHNTYSDIQLLMAGEETQLYASDPRLDNGAELLEDRLVSADVAFFSTPERYSTLRLRPGDYVIYFPGDLHCPNCAPAPDRPGKIRKFVFKIRKDL